MIGKCFLIQILADRLKKFYSQEKRKFKFNQLSFNSIQVERAFNHKHLGTLLDQKLNFKQHIDSAFLKINKGISVIKKLRHRLPRKSLMTIYKSLLRPLTDYGDIRYHLRPTSK